ncbi:hypothetical protein KY285_007802 [Solanum tuberosum]|nr:hypothetical protein KY285_007802 [Solanum tuberosum]
MESVGPDGQIVHFQGQSNPGSLHGSFGDSDFRRHFCRNVSWMSVKTLAKESIGADRFSTSFLPKIFVDVGEDLRYGGGWSRWENRPIFKVKQTPEQSFLPKFFVDVRLNLMFGAGCFRWANQPICKVKRPRSGFPASFLPNIFVDVRQDLAIELVGPDG